MTSKTLKEMCKERGLVGKAYYRALKRRQAGHPMSTVLETGYIRNKVSVNSVTINNKVYSNYAEVERAFKPVASMTTVIRKVRQGWSWEAALSYVPNPGYAKGVIYLVTNKITDTKYVGQTVQTLVRRWVGHCEDAFYRNSNLPLHDAILKDGKENFTIEVIDQGTALLDLCEKETLWIAKLNTLIPHGYNSQEKGTSGGSHGKPTYIGKLKFKTKIAAAMHLSQQKDISVDSAKKRIEVGRVDVRSIKMGVNISEIYKRHYKVWDSIKSICLRPNSKIYDPSITVYEPWMDFFKFMSDVGPCPDPSWVFTRLNKGIGFTPDNCKWVTRSEASKLANKKLATPFRFDTSKGTQQNNPDHINKRVIFLISPLCSNKSISLSE